MFLLNQYCAYYYCVVLTGIIMVIPQSGPTLMTFLVWYNFLFFLELVIAFMFYVDSYAHVTCSSLYSLRNRNHSGQNH